MAKQSKRRKASGAKVPSKPRREGSLPSLELAVVMPRLPSVAQGIENCLANPFYSIELGRAAEATGALPAGSIPPKTTLFQLKSVIDVAWGRLNALSYDLHQKKLDGFGIEARVRARELIRELVEWITLSLVQLSQTDPQEAWSIPDSIWEKSRDLALLGRKLRVVWEEVEASTRPPPSLTPLQSLKDIPPLDEKSGQWVRSSAAADRVHITTGSLANSRLRGIKNADGLSGIDDGARMWRKATPTSQVWYWRRTLPPG